MSDVFAGKKVLDDYKTKYMTGKSNRLFGEFNGDLIGLNTDIGKNIMVIGTADRGKTFNYVMPNLLKGTESAIITNKIRFIDNTDIELFRDSGAKTYFIDFSDPAHCGRYNPFRKVSERESFAKTELLYKFFTEILCELDEDATVREIESLFLKMVIKYIITTDNLKVDERNLRRIFDVLIDIEDDFSYIEKYDNTDKTYSSRLPNTKSVNEILSRLIDKISIVNDIYFDCFSEYDGCDLLTAESLRECKQYWFVHSSYGNYLGAEQANAFLLSCLMADLLETEKHGNGVHFYLDDFRCSVPNDYLASILEKDSKADFGVSIIAQTIAGVYSYCGTREKMARLMERMNAVIYFGGMEQYGAITEYTKRTLSRNDGVSLSDYQIKDISEFAEKAIVFVQDNLPIICNRTDMYIRARGNAI